jgi:hypothetical protein
MVEDFLLVGAALSFYKGHGTSTRTLADGSLSITPFDFYSKNFSPYVYGIKARKSNPNSYFYGGLNGDIMNTTTNSINATANLQGGMYYFVNANIAINTYAQLQLFQYVGNSSSSFSNSTYLGNLYFGTSMSLFLNTNKTENKAFDGRPLFKKGNAPAQFSFSASVYRTTISTRGFAAGGYQWLNASYSKEFFVKNNISLSIGSGFSASYQSFNSQVITTFPISKPVLHDILSLSVTPSAGIHYYYPLSARTFLQTGLNLNYTLRRKETVETAKSSFYTGTNLGLGYFVAPNLVFLSSISYQTARTGSSFTNKHLSTSLGFSYQMNNTRWWK